MKFHQYILTLLCTLVVTGAFSQPEPGTGESYRKTTLLFPVTEKADTSVFKVLSCNTLKGFNNDAARMAAFQNWVKERKPDVVAFQEMNGFTQKKLMSFANRAGFPYAVLQKERGFPVALISKYPITGTKKVTKGMWHGMLYGKILDYHFFVTHLSPNTYQQRIADVDTLLKYIGNIPKTEKILLMGDFNNMSPQDKKYYDNEAKMKLVRASEMNNPDIRILKNGEIEFTAIRNIINAGFYDSWKLFNKGYEKSAPTKVKKHHNYTRIDYIWVNKTLKRECLNATIVKDDFTDYMSDHYPVLLVLKKEN